MLSREPQINLKITCPACPQKLDASGVQPFTAVDCPSCGYQFVIPRRFGQYLLEEPLSEDVFCGVYRALDLKLDREICIKILDREWAGDPGTVELFQETVRRTAALNHHNIVPIYSSGDFEGLPFLVMEFMDGGSGADLLARSESLPVSRCLEMAQEAVRGLEAANREGVLHGNLHPGNILTGTDGNIKVSDFGMAMVGTSPDHSSPAGRLLPCYASPEVLRGEERDFHSDIFSLGAVLYHLLTGKPPFPADLSERVATLDALPLHKPQDLRQRLPRDTGRLVMKMLAPVPEERPGTYKALMSSLSHQQSRLRAATGGSGMRMSAVAGRSLKTGGAGTSAYLKKKSAEVHRKKRSRHILDAVILLCLIALILIFLVAASKRPSWYVKHVENRMHWAVQRLGLDQADQSPKPPVEPQDDGIRSDNRNATPPEPETAGEDTTTTAAEPGQPPVGMDRRPRPTDLDFGRAEDALRDYLRAQPIALRDLERERINRLNKARTYLQELMRYMPYKSENGIKLANGQILDGAIKSFNNDKLAIEIRGRDRPVEVRWGQIATEQYLSFFEFYIDQRLDQIKDATAGDDVKADVARDYLLLALLADWYGEPQRAKTYADEALRQDPGLRADVHRFLGYLFQ